MRPPDGRRRPQWEEAAPEVSRAGGHHESSVPERQLALTLRDEGTADALAAASVPARQLLDDALEQLAVRGVEFTADDLHDLVDVDRLPLTGSPNVVGATFLRAAKAGRIRKLGYRASTRPASRGRVVAVWRGVDL